MKSRLDADTLTKYSALKELDNLKWEEIEAISGVIGQERAEKSIEFGLLMKEKGYNVYAVGMSNSGKTTIVTEYAKKIAKEENTPQDICYVYNFKNPKIPKVLELPAGQGRKLQEDMEDFINSLKNDLGKMIFSKEYQEKKSAILKKYQELREVLIKTISEEAKEQNFGVKSTNSGIYFMPIIDGEIISEEQYEDLSMEEKDVITKSSFNIQTKALDTMRKLKDYEKSNSTEIEELTYTMGLFEIGRYMSKLLDTYGDIEKVSEYLINVREDILDNLDLFIEETQEDEDGLSSLLPMLSKKTQDDEIEKYQINLFVDNSETKSAPVIVDYNPSYSNLIGEVEYDSDYGGFTTDFMKIKAGLLHKANGGYLIIQSQDLLTNYNSYEVLRGVLKTGEIEIEPLREYSTGLAVSGIKPEPIKVDVKVILVGSYYYYDLLNYYDDEFKKIFKIYAEFDYEMDRNSGNIGKTVEFIKKTILETSFERCTTNAIKKIINFSGRLAERQDKLSAQLGIIKDIIKEASMWANYDNKTGEKLTILTEEHIEKAIFQRKERASLYEDKVNEMIDEDIIMIKTKGENIGRINGLAVYDMEDYCFAKPTLITVTSYMGKSGIVNIEKEAEMSGNIHDKGIQVLIGYLGNKYAQNFPLSLSCRICFEQNYSGVDGDSASTTELYAILSSLAEVPINQEIAVTGSMNQFGEIQPIGGVTYKVEGFYDLCKKRGLTGTQGVIIPKENIKDLVLNDEVINSIRENEFHIYAISNVDQAFEILMNVEAGSLDEKGKYTKNSIHAKVTKKLKKYHKKSME